jgi:YHS domain-containing protein/ketosteroid isomerase-like protein
MTNTVSARDIVERYFAAVWGGDTRAARRYLADDLSFAGPGAAFTTADAYLRASEHARRGVKTVELQKVFADGPDVCLFYELLMDGPVGSAAVAEWYRLDGDKIAAIRTILDTAPFVAGARRQRGQAPGETALDPVCRMTVVKAAAAATRTHQGTTYYFCNPGCAAAFEQAPETYLGAPRP